MPHVVVDRAWHRHLSPPWRSRARYSIYSLICAVFQLPVAPARAAVSSCSLIRRAPFPHGLHSVCCRDQRMQINTGRTILPRLLAFAGRPASDDYSPNGAILAGSADGVFWRPLTSVAQTYVISFYKGLKCFCGALS